VLSGECLFSIQSDFTPWPNDIFGNFKKVKSLECNFQYSRPELLPFTSYLITKNFLWSFPSNFQMTFWNDQWLFSFGSWLLRWLMTITTYLFTKIGIMYLRGPTQPYKVKWLFHNDQWPFWNDQWLFMSQMTLWNF
jgi:hypothetical protein